MASSQSPREAKNNRPLATGDRRPAMINVRIPEIVKCQLPVAGGLSPVVFSGT
jgi:hypothetical protein